MLTKNNLKKALIRCGLRKNDNVYLASSLYSLGNPKIKDKNKYYKFFYSCLREVIGNKSTIIVDAFSTNVVRFGDLHRGKKNKCTSGGLAEYIINLKSTKISDHPAHAIGANGEEANIICNNVSRNNYGINSGLYNILKIKSKILRLGIDFTISSIAHVAESIVGVPYFYQKLIKIKTEKNKKIKSNFYTMFVRHLNLKTEYDTEKIKRKLINKQGKKVKLNKGYIYCIDTKKYFDFLKNELTKDPHFLLKKKPNYKYGTIPFDGLSKNRDLKNKKRV